MIGQIKTIGNKKVVKKFLLIPFKDKNRGWQWMKSVLMVEVLLPDPVIVSMGWYNLRIATVDDLIELI